jgi:DNA polymerase-1
MGIGQMSLYGSITVSGQPDLENIRKLDLLAVPMVRKMQRYGIAIDVPYLREFSVELGAQMVELEKDISSYIPASALQYFSDRSAEIEDEHGSATYNANSAEQKRTLLYDVLKIGEGRDIKRTKAGKLSTGKKILEGMREEHPVIAKMLAYSERSKLKSAFADALPKKAKFHPFNTDGSCPVCELPHVESTWRVHTEFPMTRTETGRFASRNPNLQQIPARSELGGRIRMAFLASPGTRLVSSDFSQIELRDLAHCAKANSMMEVYRQDMDIHMYTACRTFDKDYEYYSRLGRLKEEGKLSAEEKPIWSDFALNCRLPSKNVNFMIVYGATAMGLQAQLALSGLYWTEEQCNDFIRRWFGLYGEVHAYMELQHYRARRYGYVWDVFGRVRRVPETRSCLGYIRSAGLRQAGNMGIQATSAGQTKLVMGQLDEDFTNIYSDGYGPWVWPLLTIHDQLVVEAEEDEAETVRDIMMDRFTHVMDDIETGESLWTVPIKSDGEILDRWKKE